LDADGEKFGSRHFHQKIPFGYGYPKFIHLTDLENPVNNLLPNDTLTICCRVEETESESEEKCNCQIEEHQTTIARRQLAQHLATLLNKKYADFVFKVENVKIPAHKAILAARSPVFDAMFQHNMKEKKMNETVITDVTPAAFKALLRFIYTGHCQVGLLAEQLFMAADKYDIEDLKQMCAKELRKKLTVDNAVRLLVLSDLHRANDLKDGAIRFINKNAAAVMKTPSWINFPKSHPNLLFELYSKLFESK
jgi:speckle-type POZ protein